MGFLGPWGGGDGIRTHKQALERLHYFLSSLTYQCQTPPFYQNSSFHLENVQSSKSYLGTQDSCHFSYGYCGEYKAENRKEEDLYYYQRDDIG